MANQVLRLPEVIQITGLSRSTIYREMSIGRFPTRIYLGARCVGWLSSEIAEWVELRIAERRKLLEGPSACAAEGHSTRLYF